MKTRLTAILLLAVFSSELILSCSQAYDDGGQMLINRLTQRFESNDYIGLAQLPNNPHEEMGQSFEQMYQKVLKHPRAVINRSFYGRTLGVNNEEKRFLIKAISRDLLAEEGKSFDEGRIDAVNDRVKNYQLTSESVLEFLDDSQNRGSLTEFEKQLILLELKEISFARSSSQVQMICATVEYEMSKSSIDVTFKNKILLMNSIIRNIHSSEQMGQNQILPLSFSSEPEFRKTGQMAWVAGALVLLVVVVVMELISDPSCSYTCQGHIALYTGTFLMAGLVICTESENYYGYSPCLPEVI